MMKSHGIWRWVSAGMGAISLWLAMPEARANDEYSFSWLDPDKKVYVLQNRRYLKAKRVMFSAMGGFGLSNPYRDVIQLDGRMGYYFSEEWGVEGFGNFGFFSENATMRALKFTSPAALPVIREITSEIGAVAHWAPWYAKINVFNSILYFDWFFEAGIASLRTRVDTNTNVNNPPVYTYEDLIGFVIGTGQQFHLSENFFLRLDFKGTIYSAKLLGTSGESTAFTNYTVGTGLGVRL